MFNKSSITKRKTYYMVDYYEKNDLPCIYFKTYRKAINKIKSLPQTSFPRLYKYVKGEHIWGEEFPFTGNLFYLTPVKLRERAIETYNDEVDVEIKKRCTRIIRNIVMEDKPVFVNKSNLGLSFYITIVTKEKEKLEVHRNDILELSDHEILYHRMNL
jgi:hypothetical protein